jgi:hypothetical protein
MINTLVIITDSRSTMKGTAMYELHTDEAQAAEMFRDEIADDRYNVLILKDTTIRAYILNRENAK